MKTFESLCKEAAKIVDERVKAESPSIKDTPQRRFSVFQGELTVLLVQNNTPVDVEKVREAGEKYAFGTVDEPEKPVIPPSEPAKTVISDEK